MKTTCSVPEHQNHTPASKGSLSTPHHLSCVTDHSPMYPAPIPEVDVRVLINFEGDVRCEKVESC